MDWESQQAYFGIRPTKPGWQAYGSVADRATGGWLTQDNRTATELELHNQNEYQRYHQYQQQWNPTQLGQQSDMMELQRQLAQGMMGIRHPEKQLFEAMRLRSKHYMRKLLEERGVA